MEFTELFANIEGERNRSLATAIEANDSERRVKPPFRLPTGQKPDDDSQADDGGYRVRPSSISDFCPRKEALRVEHKRNEVDVVRQQLGRIFRFGRVFERHIRNDVIGRLGILIGQWRCQRCDFQPAMVEGATRYPMPKECRICRHDRFHYVEEHFFDPETRIGGAVDGVIRWNDEYHLADFKTANDRNFSEVVKKGKPSERYVGQLQTYMWLSGIHSAVLIYYNKNNSEQHVLWLSYDRDLVSRYRQRAMDLKQWMEGSPILPTGLCGSDSACERARGCLMRSECFAK